MNILNVTLFVISLAIQYTSQYSKTEAALGVLTSFIIVLAVAITSSIVGYYCEHSRRMEHELILTAQAEIEKTQSILKLIFPEFVRARVKEGTRYIAENQGELTIIFCDICDFEKICGEYLPNELTNFLDQLFRIFDGLCDSTGITKVETVGKTYMACAGLGDSDNEMPNNLRTVLHARRAVEFALAIIQEVKEIQLKNGSFLHVKIGINSGPVSAGVVGHHKPQFSLVGDTVNTASRMCSTLDAPNQIQISESTYCYLKDYPEYEFSHRTVYAKGKGEIPVYLVKELKADNSDTAAGLCNSSVAISRNSLSEMSFNLDFIPKRSESRASRT